MADKRALHSVPRAGPSVKSKLIESQDTGLARLTIYTTPNREFAVRYLALREQKSVSKLMNEWLERMLHKAGINPDALREALP